MGFAIGRVVLTLTGISSALDLAILTIISELNDENSNNPYIRRTSTYVNYYCFAATFHILMFRLILIPQL